MKSYMNAEKPKITFVCHHLGMGGAERVLSILINYFCQNSYSIQLIMLLENRIDYAIPTNIEIACLDWKTGKDPFQILLRIKKLKRIIKGDIVISFLFPAIFFAAAATMFSKKCTIVSERGEPSIFPSGIIRKALRTASYFYADAVIFQTEAAKNYFPASIQTKSFLIPNPIKDELPAKDGTERESRIVSVCRLDTQKNIPMAIDAFAEFSKEYPEYIFEIYGDGPLEQELTDYITSLSLQDKVFLKGFSHTVHADIVDAMMYVSSSDYEGISNSMLEAMAIGLPVICTDCPAGGARQTITNGHNGMLIPVGDTAALKEAMCKIAEDKDYRDRIAKNAMKVRETYKADNICRAWEKVINAV